MLNSEDRAMSTNWPDRSLADLKLQELYHRAAEYRRIAIMGTAKTQYEH
jgi:hypothetical protein